MRQHSNAALTPSGRKLLVARVVEGWTLKRASAAAGVSAHTAHKWVKRFAEFGDAGLLDRSSRPHLIHRRNMPAGEELKSAVLALLHQPPSAHGFARSTWRMRDLRDRLAELGTVTSVLNITTTLRAAGYRYRQARVCLTSNDPSYREKVEAIQATLRNLGTDEAFFSIDEFGPFRVKMQKGRSLQPPGVVRTVPQWQRTKGFLILSAALELRTNQITHFYSPKKNTAETLALIERLRKGYRSYRCIYLSWDAAPWHESKGLLDRIEQLNEQAERDGAPRIELRPLPTCSQFLNVIESVFSGMSRAILHNSDYADVDAAKQAIDAYIRTRNKVFKANPRVAGSYIWGKERVPARFSFDNACKDPRYW